MNAFTHEGTCDVVGCKRTDIRSKRMCTLHYTRWYEEAKSASFRRPFTVSMWNRWLRELNEQPTPTTLHLRAGLADFRTAIEEARG